MQDDPLEDVIEEDDFFGEEVEVTAPAPAPGMTQGTYVGKYGDSGTFPGDGVDGIPNTELHFSTFTTLLLFACFILMVICAAYLISMFLGYV